MLSCDGRESRGIIIRSDNKVFFAVIELARIKEDQGIDESKKRISLFVW